MSAPHHHVFNAIQPLINSSVSIHDVLPRLVSKNLLKPELQSVIEGALRKSQHASVKVGEGRRAMKILTSHLRLRDFETFLEFYQCIAEASCDPNSLMKTDFQILISIKDVVQDFDNKHKTDHCKKVTAIFEQYQKPAIREGELLQTERETETEESIVSKKQVASSLAETEKYVKLEEQIASSSFSLPKTEESTPISLKLKELSLEKTSTEPTVTEKPTSSFIKESMTKEVQGSHSACCLPDLPFVTEPEYVSFSKMNLHYYNSDWELYIDMPSSAIPEERPINLKLGVCCAGPFDIPDKYDICTSFFCIASDSNFQGEADVKIEHCLTLPCYRKDKSVVVLRADHTSVTCNGRFTFSYLLHPDIPEPSSETNYMPVLSFKVTEFCILCGALEKSSNTDAKDPCSDPSSQDCSLEDDSSISTENNKIGSKRKLLTKDCSVKNQKRIEYAVLFYEPSKKEKFGPSFDVLAFVCLNCSVSFRECKKQAEQSFIPSRPHKYEFNFGKSKAIHFKIVDEQENAEWQVTPRQHPLSVTEKQVNLYNQPLNQNEKKDLIGRVDTSTYPPCLVFEVHLKFFTSPTKFFSCKVIFDGLQQHYNTKEQTFYQITAPFYKGERSFTERHPQPSNTHAVNHYISKLSQDQLLQDVTTQCLCVVSMEVYDLPKLTSKIPEVANDVLQLLSDNPDYRERVYKTLYLWIKRKRTTSISELITVLHSANEFNALESLISHLQ